MGCSAFGKMKKHSLVMATALMLNGTALAAGPMNKDLYDRATQARPAVLKLLESLVNIDSGTGSEKGLDLVGAMVADEAKKLGMRVEFSSAAPAVGKNLVASLKGTGKARILLMAHMDTVFADGTAAARPFRIQGDRAYGPGVVDDKGGIVAALFAIRLLQQIKFTDFSQITLLVNTNEETFSKGTFPLIESLAKQHDVTLSMESGRAADGLVIWRKGTADLLIDVKGKSAHAGVAPEAGRNAAMEASHQMLQMSKLGDSAKLTTVNFTVIHAGERANVIPNAATVRGDMRATELAEFDRVEKEMARMAESKLIAGTEVKSSLTRGMAPMPVTARTQALAARAQAIYGELGLKLTMEGSGGAADANFASGVGAAALDGFGIVGGAIHSEDEYAELNSIAPRLYLLARMIMDVSTKPLQR
ncbi:MAG: glutamyl aminopeptidase family protein [Massilia sp.]|nr:glutamyl aminopeptidase family protein [Massilia sp.]MDB5791421.1 glutamyl aminopeptidase family protein [Massilia sp.]